MPHLTATWHPIPHLPHLPRSAHTLSIVRSSLHLFSGEYNAYSPAGSELHILPLNPAIPISITVLASPTGPPPCVGAASATLGEILYVFGGCGVGKQLLEEGGRLWTFEAGSQEWKALDPTDECAPFPEARSYHTVAVAGGKVYVHGGSTEITMPGDLWAFDVVARRWDRLRDAPGEGRIRAGIAVTGGREIWRFGGFDGFNDVGGVVDVYDIHNDIWRTIPYPTENGPTPRSVSSIVPITHAATDKEYLIIIFGDCNPKQHLRDIWAYDIAAAEWCKVEVSGEEKDQPVSRGWFATAPVAGEGAQGIVLQGGVDGEDNRLGDWWILMFD